MSTWHAGDLQALTAPDEVHVVIRRPDGTLRRPRIIWIVRNGDRAYIRSTNGPTADWFRGALSTGTGQVRSNDNAFEVTFTQVADDDELGHVDDAYRTKYGRYPSIVDHLEEDGPRSATLEVQPAQ